MQPNSPQKTLQHDLNRLALFLFIVFPILIVLIYIGLAQVMGLMVLVFTPVLLIAYLIGFIIMLQSIYKAHGLKHPLLATFSGIAALGVINLVLSSIVNVGLNTVIKPGTDAATMAVNYQSYWIIAIVVILVELAISYFILSYVLGKFIPGLAYFSADPALIPAAPVTPPATTAPPLPASTPPAPTEPPPTPPVAPPPAPPTTPAT